MKIPAARWIGYPAAVLVVLATIGLLKLFPQLTVSSIALLLLLAVFLCASVWQSGPGVLAAVLATLGFNFFFLPPLYTFTIADPRNVTALFVFLVSGLLIGRLSALSRQRLGLLEAERRDLIALTQLSQGFLSDTNRETLFGVAADRLRQALHCEQVAILLADAKGELSQRIETANTSFRRRDRRSRLRAGQLRGVPVRARRHGHLPSDTRRPPAGRGARRARPALERAHGGSLRPPPRPRRRARALPAARQGVRGDPDERTDEVDPPRAARPRSQDSRRGGTRIDRELGSRDRRLGGLAACGRAARQRSAAGSAS